MPLLLCFNVCLHKCALTLISLWVRPYVHHRAARLTRKLQAIGNWTVLWPIIKKKYPASIVLFPFFLFTLILNGLLSSRPDRAGVFNCLVAVVIRFRFLFVVTPVWSPLL
jgi:hypothetical protein